VKRWLLAGTAGVAVAAAGAALWFLPSLRAEVQVGEGYLAKQVCSCMFVAGRDFAACRADVPEVMDPLSAEPLADGVRAWLVGFGERTARYVPERGCALDAD
jgi:hypothetical protein